MKRGDEVTILADKILEKLKPYCNKIKVAGSIRRHKENPEDIDIVLIPKDKLKIEQEMAKFGKRIQGGEHESTWKIQGVNVELYYTNKDEWGAELLAARIDRFSVAKFADFNGHN